MTLHGQSRLVTDTPVRGKLSHYDGKATPVLSFMPALEGVFDILPSGTAAEQVAWLIQLREEAGALAIQVQRHHAEQARIAQEAALATYPEAVGA